MHAATLSAPSARFAILSLISLVLAGVVTPTALRAQRDKKPPKKIDTSWREDPYTKSDPAILETAGYQRIDRIGWTEGFGSERVEQALGRVKVRWIETAHFRIGCALPKWKVPGHDKMAKRRLKLEFKQLRSAGLKLRGSPKTIDPWLRAHLYALRLETLYANFASVVDHDKPVEERLPLDKRQKFRVLILDEESGCERYLQTFANGGGKSPMRWQDSKYGGHNLATAVQFSPETYGDDTALYCHVAFQVIHNLMNSFCPGRYGSESSIWWREGYAHTVRRGISDAHNGYSSIEKSSEHAFSATDWERRTLKMTKSEMLRPFEEITGVQNFGDLGFRDHIQIWSRVDFLRAQGDENFGDFVRAVTKGSDQSDALEEHFGFDAEAFDARWIRWLKKEYRGA